MFNVNMYIKVGLIITIQRCIVDIDFHKPYLNNIIICIELWKVPLLCLYLYVSTYSSKIFFSARVIVINMQSVVVFSS